MGRLALQNGKVNSSTGFYLKFLGKVDNVKLICYNLIRLMVSNNHSSMNRKGF